jgi:hypothetical protein
MAAAEPIAVLQAQLKDTIARFSDDRVRHKRVALYVKLSTSGLSAVAMVLLGWTNPPSPEWFKNLALVLNASITLLSAYDAFFEPRKLWARETGVHNKLKDLEREVELKQAANQLSPDQVMKYGKDLNDVLNGSLEGWLKDKK